MSSDVLHIIILVVVFWIAIVQTTIVVPSIDDLRCQDAFITREVAEMRGHNELAVAAGTYIFDHRCSAR